MDLELFDDDQLLDDKHHDLIKKLVAFCGKQLKLPENTEMSITLVGDDEIERINREYRETDRVTDVISFAIEEGEDDLPLLPGMAKNIGDLFIDPLTVRRHAEDYGHSFERELGCRRCLTSFRFFMVRVSSGNLVGISWRVVEHDR